MASKTTLNAGNLEALGAPRLAELLMEISKGDAAIKRHLRLELASLQSPGDVAREVRKRLKTIARSRSFVDWQKLRPLISDLEMQRRAIVDQVAKADPVEALGLMWEFLALGNSVFASCDDSNGAVMDVFHQAADDLGEIAKEAEPSPKPLADRLFAALIENDYGQYDELIDILSPTLGADGLDHLKTLVTELADTPIAKPAKEDREIIGYGSSGPVYADDYAERRRKSMVRFALQQIADAQGDVDAFIAQQSEKAKTVPGVAAEIARRLLAAGRPEEALSAINAIEEGRPGWIPFEWEATRVAVLEALGRHDEAQEFRWACFERSLSDQHLRDYLKRLADFDDIEAEERAMSVAFDFPQRLQALAFLVRWPALDKAAQLVLNHADEWNGDHYELLSPAADALETKHPLAATVLRRAMIDFALKNARSKRYRHAARHLMQCSSLAGSIEDFGTVATHDAYAAQLKAEHGRKSGFWGLVG
jgi:hypothetical protein